MNAISNLSRRGFLATVSAAGGGLALGLHVPGAAAQGTAPGALPPEVNAWVVIKPDETVVVRIGRVEMGQGTLTGLAQLVAEELDCDWAKVTTEYPTPGQNLARKRVWGSFQTAGSQGVRGSQDAMRKGGAAARMMLVQAAAEGWSVPASECTVADGIITHGPSKRTTSYGKVAAAAARLTPPTEIALKDPKTWKLAGKPVKRLDTAPKTNGSQIYSIDMTMPGMLNAAIKITPTYGGKVKSFDAAAVLKMPGVKYVLPVGPTAVAVVADTWWRAKTALDALPIEWDAGPNADFSSATIAAALKTGLTAPNAAVGAKTGDALAAIAGAAKTVEAEYAVPYQHHATMEPMNATARWTADRCEVWTATQDASAALTSTVSASGLPVEKCEVYRMLLGGGFGRRATSHDFVEQAVIIAKQIPGVPIKLIWSREEDMLHGYYHPVTQARLVGGLNAQGELVGLHMRIAGQSILQSLNPAMTTPDPIVFQGLGLTGEEGRFGYTAIPNLLIDHVVYKSPIPAGFWRGVNNNQNSLYLECFMDELALAAGVDALEFRRKLLVNSPKHLAVLNAVADKGGWGKPRAPGRFLGLSQHMGYGSYVAACAEVSVSDAGVLTIHKITAATDPGHVVNPQQVTAQVEGSFVFGLSAALHGEITIAGGKVEQENFDTYGVMKMDEMPEVEAILMPSGGFWGGVGEPTIFVAAPAVLNAIYAATGKRVRQLPLSKTDLKKA
jgi:isoquinoline 1-oxidoreductase beta subunit